MLTTNLCVPFGLFNWATGTIIDLIYKNENRPENSIPDVVMVQFDNYSGPSFIEENVIPDLLMCWKYKQTFFRHVIWNFCSHFAWTCVILYSLIASNTSFSSCSLIPWRTMVLRLTEYLKSFKWLVPQL
jgi:hypothetical protein